MQYALLSAKRPNKDTSLKEKAHHTHAHRMCGDTLKLRELTVSNLFTYVICNVVLSHLTQVYWHTDLSKLGKWFTAISNSYGARHGQYLIMFCIKEHSIHFTNATQKELDF